MKWFSILYCNLLTYSLVFFQSSYDNIQVTIVSMPILQKSFSLEFKRTENATKTWGEHSFMWNLRHWVFPISITPSRRICWSRLPIWKMLMLSSHRTAAKTVMRFVSDVQAYLKKYEMAGLIPSLNSKNMGSNLVVCKTRQVAFAMYSWTRQSCVLYLVKKIGVTHQMDICVTQNKGISAQLSKILFYLILMKFVDLEEMSVIRGYTMFDQKMVGKCHIYREYNGWKYNKTL